MEEIFSFEAAEAGEFEQAEVAKSPAIISTRIEAAEAAAAGEVDNTNIGKLWMKTEAEAVAEK